LWLILKLHFGLDTLSKSAWFLLALVSKMVGDMSLWATRDSDGQWRRISAWKALSNSRSRSVI